MYILSLAARQIAGIFPELTLGSDADSTLRALSPVQI